MAQKGVELNQERFSCFLCLALLKDPVGLHCGHSYCMSCIKNHWDGEDMKKIYSCPQCRRTFAPRPVLDINTMLADLVGKLKKTGPGPAADDHCYTGDEDVVGTAKTQLLLQHEPQTRAEFLTYSREITLDPNTANEHLLLSEENKRVTWTDQNQNYPPHPDRFSKRFQVMSREILTGRCYWEVEWSGWEVWVVVAYKDSKRKENSDESLFGFNDKSWALRCTRCTSEYWYNGVQSFLSGPVLSRIGVYLDHTVGILSFYSVSDTMTLIHRVQTTFTKPLYAGIWTGDTAYFPKLH